MAEESSGYQSLAVCVYVIFFSFLGGHIEILHLPAHFPNGHGEVETELMESGAAGIRTGSHLGCQPAGGGLACHATALFLRCVFLKLLFDRFLLQG